VITMARTDISGARKGGRSGTFIITPDLPSVGRKDKLRTPRIAPTVQLNFDNMRVPAENLLGDETQGLHLYNAVPLDNGRLGIAARRRSGSRARHDIQ